MIRLFSGAVAALMISASASQAANYLCKMTDVSNDGFVTKEYLFILDTGSTTGQVIDPIIQYVHKKPIAAKVSKRSGNKYAFSWRVKGLKTDANSKTNVGYRAMLDIGAKTVRVSAAIAGADNQPRGQGTCRLR